MRHRGDLGVPGLTAVLFLLIPVVALVLRRKWILAAARREEVARLLLLAKEEAERAEMEAVFPYSFEPRVLDDVGEAGVGESMVKQCAVCYSPTTTRCSRCKAVRYCSGKCQIIHWRQGHKDKCRFPADSSDASGCYSDIKATKAAQTKTAGEDSCMFSSQPAESQSDGLRPIDTPNSSSSLRPLSKVDNCVLAERPKAGSCSIFVSSMESSEGGSTNVESSSSGEKCLFGNATRSTSGSTINNANSSHCLFVPMSSGIENLSFSSDSTERTSACPRDSCGLTSSSHSVDSGDRKACNTFADTDPHEHKVTNSGFVKSRDPSHSKHSKKVVAPKVGGNGATRLLCSLSATNIPTQMTSGNEVCLGSSLSSINASVSKGKEATPCRLDAPVSVANGRKSLDEPSLMSKGPKPPRPDFVFTHRSSNGASNPNAASRTDSLSTHIDVSKDTNDASTGGPVLRSSVRSFVQQLKSSKLSKSSEMPSPYDFFMKLYYEKVELQPCGLINCGNSCYANAVLQCLTFTKPLTAYLLQGLHSKSCPKREWCFTCEFENLVLKTKQGKSPLSPIGILSQIHNIGSHLGHGREEDAHEFLRYAIEAMQSACVKEAGQNAKSLLVEETTLVQLVFGGYLRSKIKCMKCHGTSVQCEKMMDLTVEIYGDIKTLQEALARFTATEVLDGENKYQCNRCKSDEKAKKKLEIFEAPNVLTIALKRFQSGKFGKLNKPVMFPEILNIAEYLSSQTRDSNPVYSLYAVVVHLDVLNAAFSGHYVCYVKNAQGKWFKIDDSAVKPVEVDRVLSKGAYLLLYARVSPRAPSFIRNSMVCDSGKSKSKKWQEASFMVKNGGNSVSKSRSDCTNRREASMSVNPFGPFSGSLTSDDRARSADSSSDSSSLISCSDEGSCSTESNQDSTSTESYSDYIFGNSGRFSWDSPHRSGEDRDSLLSYSPMSSRYSSDLPSSNNSISDFSNLSEEDVCQRRDLSYEVDILGQGKDETSTHRESRELCSEGRDGSPFLPPNITTHCRKLSEQRSSSETDRSNPSWMTSSLLTRRTTRDLTSQRNHQ